MGVRGASNLHYQQYLVLVIAPEYPYDTLYPKMIPDGDNIIYKQNPYCGFPCNTISLVWWFHTKKQLLFQHRIRINDNINVPL